MSTFERVVRVLEKMDFNVDEVKMSTNFSTDMQLDSLDHVEIMMELEEEFGMKPTPNEDDDRLITVGSVVEYIDSL